MLAAPERRSLVADAMRGNCCPPDVPAPLPLRGYIRKCLLSQRTAAPRPHVQSLSFLCICRNVVKGLGTVIAPCETNRDKVFEVYDPHAPDGAGPIW